MAVSGGIRIDPRFLPTLDGVAQKDRRWPITSGLAAGLRDLESYGGSVAEGAGQLFGLPAVQDVGASIVANAREAQAAGRQDLNTPPWREGGAPVLPWLAYQASRQVPLLASYLLAGRLIPQSAVPAGLERFGASVPRVLGGGGLKAGADFARRRAAIEAGRDFGRSVVGAEVAGLPVAFASMYQEAQNQPGGASTGDVVKAAALSPLYSALDALEPAQFKGLLSRGLAGNILKRVATAGLVSGAAEVPQEGIQTAIEQSFRPDLSPGDKMSNIVDAAVTGGAVGGVFGGIGGVRAMKRTNPSEVTTDDLNAVVSNFLSLPPPGQRAAFTPDGNMAVTPEGVVQPGSDFVQSSFDTQPAPIAETRPMRDRTDEELLSGARAAQGLLSSYGKKQFDDRGELVNNYLRLINAELQNRDIEPPTVNASATNDNVPTGAVGAVERGSDVSGGSAATSAVPASTNFNIDELTKGVGTRKAYFGATNIEEARAILLNRLENGSKAKGDMVMADRLGVDLNEPAKVATAQEGTQGQTPVEATVDQDFRTQWRQMLNKRRGAAIKDLRENMPANREEAQRQVYDALAKNYNERSDGYKGLIELAKLVGLHNEEGQLTDEGVKIARQALPLELTVKEALSRGYTAVEASAFDKGARGDRAISVKSFAELKAFNDGRDWASNRNAKNSPVPETAPESETETQTAKLGNTVKSAGIPERQRNMQFLNQAIDQVYSSSTTPQEQAQLKRMVREGASGAQLDEAARYFATGRGALVQEQPTKQEFKGEVVDRGPLIRARERARAAAEAEGEALTQRRRVRESIPEMEGLRDEYVQRQKQREVFRDRLRKISEEIDAEEAQAGEVPELKFRRGTKEAGLTSTAVADHVREVTQGWKSKTNIEVYQSVDDLPDDVQRAIVRDGAEDAYGFVHNGTIHMIADNIPNRETAVATIYHEALGHLGLQRMFHAQLDSAMTSLYHGNENLKSLVDTWQRANPNAYGGNLARATEEVLAEMSERGTIEASWLAKIGAIIKAFARRMGLNLEVTDNELNAILAMAHDQTIHGAEKESRTVKGLRYMLQLWHGSPHDFDQFLTDKIGTGEGAQVYGWGLYFSSIKDVAQSYRDNLADMSPPKVDGQDPIEWVSEHTPKANDGKPILDENQIYSIGRQANYMMRGSGIWRDLRDEYDANWMEARREGRPDKVLYWRTAIDMLDKLYDAKPTGVSRGKLYNVNVQGIHDQFMDWFKPLTKQSPQVKTALKKLGVWPDEAEIRRTVAIRDAAQERYQAAVADAKKGLGVKVIFINEIVTSQEQNLAFLSKVSFAAEALRQAQNAVLYSPSELTGADIYHQLVSRMETEVDGGRRAAAKAASEMLLDAGIRGNTYQDQFSRGGGKGNYNYVVFSHDDVQIANKYKRPDEINTAARETFKNVISATNKAIDADGVAGKVRRFLLGFQSIHGANEFYGKWFDRKDGQGRVVANGMTGYEAALNEKTAIQARLAQFRTDVADAYGALQRTNADSANKIIVLMRASEFGINPTKPWREQSQALRTSSNKANLERLSNQFHDIYRALLGRGHATVYDDLRNVNDISMLATLANSLHQAVAADQHAVGKMSIFDENPMEEFMREQSTRQFTPADARKWWHDQLQQMLNSTFNLIGSNRAVRDNPATPNAERESLATHVEDLGKRVNGMQQVMTQLDEAPYFHLGRYGDFFVGWKATNAEALAKIADKLSDLGFDGVITNGTDKLNVYMRLENASAQRNLDTEVRRMEKAGLIEEGSIRTGQRNKAGFAGGFLPQAMQAAIAEIDASKMDDDLKEIAKQEILSRMVDLMPEMSLARVLTKRRNIPGYSPDMMRSFDWRQQVGNNALAGMVVSPKITQAFVDMRGALDDAEKGSLVEASVEQRRGMRDILDEYTRRERERANWPETHLLDQIKGISSAWFLGASVSYGLVNMTQLGVTLLPELGAKHGFSKAFGAIAKATPLALRIMAEVAKHGKKVSLSRAMDAVITHDVLAKTAGKDMTEYLMRVANTGNLDIGGFSRELIRSAEGRGQGGVDQVLRYASSVGYYTETASRLIAAIAYRQLNRNASVEDAADKAAYLLNETMWNYARTNQGRQFGKAGILGRYTPLATQFMQYQAQLTEKLFRETYSAIKGDTAVERAEARRFLAGHLSAMIALAGTLGLPMVTFLAMAFDRLKDLWDDDDQPSDVRAAYRGWLANVFGKDAGRIIAHGGLRAANLDISQRIGEQDLIPFSQFLADRRDFTDKLPDLALKSWGSPAGLAANLLKGGQQLLNGNVMDGLIKMLPNALAGPSKAYKLKRDGYVDAEGKKLPIDQGATDVLVQALGFNPGEKAEYNEKRGQAISRRGELTRDATVIRDQLARAIISGDNDRARELIGRAQRFDQANPSFAVLPHISDVLRRRAKVQALGRVTNTPLGADPRDLAEQRLVNY